MKLKQICIFCICLSVSFLYAGNVWFFPPSTYFQYQHRYKQPYLFSTEKDLYSIDGTTGEFTSFPCFVGDDKYIYVVYEVISYRLDRKDIHINTDLYQRVDFDKTYGIVIEGGGFFTSQNNFIITSEKINKEFIELRKDLLKDSYDSFSDRYSDLLDYTWIMPNIVKSVKMSAPFLAEMVKGQRVVYDDDMLRFRWFLMCIDKSSDVSAFFINDSTPMVEGAAGNGRGLVLDIDFHIPSDNLVVLNGFVDTDRPHLYKMNARMKTVRVQGDGFDFEYTFKDYVHFAQIDFPKQVTKVKLTVTDVYDGEKWEDMAISGLWVNPDILKTANTDLAREYLKYAEEGMTERILYGWQIERDKKKQEERDRTKKQNVQE